MVAKYNRKCNIKTRIVQGYMQIVKIELNWIKKRLFLTCTFSKYLKEYRKLLVAPNNTKNTKIFREAIEKSLKLK